ncbi:MAG: LysM peptidoglycan-binding domain-containing protein [Ghiorsea sp.]
MKPSTHLKYAKNISFLLKYTVLPSLLSLSLVSCTTIAPQSAYDNSTQATPHIPSEPTPSVALPLLLSVKKNRLQEAEKIKEKPPISSFLQNITANDLIIIQQEASRVTLPHWATTDTRASKIRQRVLHTLNTLHAPTELQFIPVAESAYQPYALSPAGAFGLWQLMPKTAIELGAVHKNGIDGRRHIESSTKAAVTYLLKLHKRFNNWTLAICAYNLGPWGVERRLRKSPWQPEMGLNALPFPAETRHYVKQILGMIALHDAKQLTFSNPVNTTSTLLQAPIDLNHVAQVADLEKNEMFRFNPGLDYQHYLHHNITIHLPQEKTALLQQALLDNPDIFKPKHISIMSKKGDSLWKIAKRYHTSIRQLRRLNPKLKHTLSIGEQLTVPAHTNYASSRARSNPLLAQGRRIRYKVKRGDSLWKIAKKFGTSSHAIAKINQISQRHLIRPGDRLWIFARYRPS